MENTKYTKMGAAGFSCACCGTEIKPDDEVAVCPDCGAIFCKTCAESGGFEGHECEEGDIDQ